jgi:hypothetical protein
METVQTQIHDSLSSDVVNHILSEKEIIELMVRVCFPPQDLEIISTKDQDRDNTPLPPPLPGFLWAGVKEEKTRQPVTLPSIEEVITKEIPPRPSSSSLPAVEKSPFTRKPSGVNRFYAIAKIVFFLSLGILGFIWGTVAREKAEQRITQSIENSSSYQHTEKNRTFQASQQNVRLAPEQTERRITKTPTLTYLVGKDDYPTLLAYACGVPEGWPSYRWMVKNNPQKIKGRDVFKTGEAYNVPCELNATIIAEARQRLKLLRSKKEEVRKKHRTEIEIT